MKDFTEQLKNYTVLCVEDENGIRKRLVNTLNYYFKEVYEASDGEEGFDLYYDKKPTVIISDIEMPKKNGIEMVEEIRKNDLTTIIIMLTAYSSEDYLFNLINLNINHYILKPVISKTLFQGIIKAFGDKLHNNIIFTDDLYFDLQQRELFYQQEIVVLRKRDKDFLLLMHENKNRVLTYTLIEEYIWKDKTMSMSALKTFIKELRQRLPIDLIDNITQEGYKLKL